MICECCKNEIKMGKTTCSRCGMPILTSAGISDAIKKEEIRKIKESYLSDIHLYIRTYLYEIRSGSVVETGTERLPLCKALQLQEEQILWSDTSFESVDSDRDFSIALTISRKGQSEDITVPFHPDKVMSHGRVGVMPAPGFCFRMVIGSPEQYAVSEVISLI